VQLLDDDGRVEWLNERLMVATCAVQTGVLEEMLAMTTRYVAGRERFGAPIGSFQSVSHRLADAGHRVSASCQHVHGGIGHDRDYPLWRYAIRARHNELLHGGASQAQAALGAAIARAPAAAAL
jgi:alkylation response protein AidB-like acyl-CoA dehydrogenase